MADTLALSKLVADVEAYFDAAAATTVFAFGWREPTKQTNQGPGRANRILFVPGDDSGEDADMGKDAPARNPGRNPRPIGTLVESFTVYVWAYDGTAPENELKQYEAARFLYDAWRAAMYHAARGTFTIEKQAWRTKSKERRLGAEIRALCTVQAMIPDTPWREPSGPVTAETVNSIALAGGDEICCET